MGESDYCTLHYIQTIFFKKIRILPKKFLYTKKKKKEGKHRRKIFTIRILLALSIVSQRFSSLFLTYTKRGKNKT